MMEPEPIKVVRDGAVAEVVLNRPHRRNALTEPMMAALRDAFIALSADPAVHAIVVRGEDGAFCSGLDVKEMKSEPPPVWLPRMGQTWREANVAMARCRKPMVAALQKFAINGGAPIAFACDLLIAGESASISITEARLGMQAGINLAWLQAKYAEATALYFTLRAEPVPAADLLRLGIATQVVPDDQVLAVARALAQQVASYPPAATQSMKRAIRELNSGGLADPEAWFARGQAAAQFGS